MAPQRCIYIPDIRGGCWWRLEAGFSLRFGSSGGGRGMYDLVIRGATVVDGLGHEPRRADVAVEKGRIAYIGEVGRDATRVVDAGGLTLMPGIIDIHTHYDAQVTWDATI